MHIWFSLEIAVAITYIMASDGLFNGFQFVESTWISRLKSPNHFYSKIYDYNNIYNACMHALLYK